MDPRIAQLLGGLPDIFAKYVDQPWWNAYREQFQNWMQNPNQGNQVTLPPMVTPTPQVPAQPTSYAPFTGALPSVAAVNPWGQNNHTAYDNRGDMDARMAMGGWGAGYVPPVVPTTPQPPVTRPPVYTPPVVTRPPTQPSQPTQPRPTQPTSPYVPGPGIPGYQAPAGYPGGYWPNFGRGYTPATNSAYANGYAETGRLRPGQQNLNLMRPETQRRPRTFTGWG